MMAGLVEGHECATCIVQGYDSSRFVVRDPISESFHCPICMNVLKDPVMCENNQHYFCRGCITEHLKNTNNCPTCQDQLGLETLVKAPRIVIEYLSELRIRCDFFSRGCRDVVQLSGLQQHIKMCRFAAVKCSNDGCNVVVNRQDKLHHEAEVCEFRRLQCHDCVELKKAVKNIREKTMEDNANVKKQVDKLSTKLQQQIDDLSEKLTEDNSKLQKQVDELSTKLLRQVGDLGEKIAEKNAKLQQHVDKLGENIGRMSEMQTVTIIIIIIMTIFTMMIADTKYPQQMMPKPNRRSILIAGGQEKDGDPINSVEVFNWPQRTWTFQNAMSTHRSRASAVIYKGMVIISGGHDEKARDTMETSICEEPLQWNISPVKLPEVCKGHAAVMYKDSLILSGGEINITSKETNKICAVSMVPPYSSNILTTMPEQRYDHTMELFEDRLFIFGGYTFGAKDSVMMYDLITKEWKMMTPLPFAVDEMATVLWQNNVIILGGRKGGDGIDTVLMYNLRSGEHKYLPSMKHKRAGCTAVVTGDVLVVMGGHNRESKYLKSVEAFSFQHQVWEELPDMNRARAHASAVVKPN